MCIAIVTTPGKTISSDVFEKCWRNNQDGFGVAYISGIDGKVVIDKGWLHKDGAKKAYHRMAEDNKNADRYMLLHFRAATVGGVDQENCHPFKVKGGAMIHNGTFWRDPNAKKADSRMLAEIMHNELTYNNLSGNKAAFDKAFGYNRVAFLFDDNKPVIFSEEFVGNKGQFGQWKDGIWYSNGGWKGAYNGYYGDDEDMREAQRAEDANALRQLDRTLWGRGRYGNGA